MIHHRIVYLNKTGNYQQNSNVIMKNNGNNGNRNNINT